MIVKQILALKGSNKVETISAKETISTAAQVLAQKKIGALIVSKTGADVAGIVSERDVVRALAESGEACLPKLISSIMTENVITCSPADKAVRILEIMTERRFRHMPVFEDGELVGVISIGDVV
jgi:CBS domain-containing protein